MNDIQKSWTEVEKACASQIAQLYVNKREGDDVSEVALNLAVDAWAKAMKEINPHGVRQVEVSMHIPLDELSLEDKLGIVFAAPHPSLIDFARTVRFAAAVAQKVA